MKANKGKAFRVYFFVRGELWDVMEHTDTRILMCLAIRAAHWYNMRDGVCEIKGETVDAPWNL